jgi:glycolate oxidase FAD binding subunit
LTPGDGFVIASPVARLRNLRIVPQELRPTSPDELRDIVAGALAEEKPLRVVGAGSKDGFGRPLALPGLHVDGLSGIGLYEPEELVMTVGAGTPMAEIEARLADNHQQLAFEPPDYGAFLGGATGRATIGGVLACNLSGPRRIKAGAARDHFLGVQVVTGRGELIKAGGRVVKNVTGYDLCKLLAGSFGTLAVMTEVTVKVLPAAEQTLTLTIAGLGVVEALGALRAAMASAHDASGAAYLPAAAAARCSVATIASAGTGIAAVRLEGPGPSLRHRADALKELLNSPAAEIGELDTAHSSAFWREVRDVALLPDEALLWRVSLPPSAGAELIGALETQLSLQWLADWAGGLIWLAVDRERLTDGGATAIRTALAAYGGHATLIRADAALRAKIEVFQPQAEPLARLSARVKESFDPKRILNPGRMYPDV